MNGRKLSRRRFIGRSLGCAAALGATGAVGLVAHTDRARLPERSAVPRHRPPERGPAPAAAGAGTGDAERPLLVVVRRADAGEPTLDGGDLVRRAVETAGAIDRFVARGDRVVVKPNVGWNRTPEQAATTDPRVVAAVVALCRDAGARDVLVTDHTCHDPRMCFERSGIRTAAEASGARVEIPVRSDWVEVDLEGEVIGRWAVLRAVLEADRLISVPVAKQHGLAEYTGTMKNLYGVMGGNRGRLHREMAPGIVDMVAWARPTLHVVDGMRVLVRNGPTGGRLEDVERRDSVIVSADPVAADALGCTLIGKVPQEVAHVRLAAERGLGELEPDVDRVAEVVL